MTEMTWEKARAGASAKPTATKRRYVALVGFVVMGIMAAMIFAATISSGRFFITVSEVLARPELLGKTVKISGAVIGPTIKFDADTQTISFTMANVPDNLDEIEKAGGLAKALHLAVIDTNAKRIDVVVKNEAMPDLLQNEAQAILSGKLGDDGIFYAQDLQLKCPSKYESSVPQQVKE